MSAFTRVLRVGIKAENCLTRFQASKAHSTSSSSSAREFSQLVKSTGTGVHRLDTSLLEKSLEGQGFSCNQAKAISCVVFEIWNNTLDNLDDAFAKSEEMEKMEESYQKRLTEIKIQSWTEQECHFSWSFHKMKELNQNLGSLLAKVHCDMENLKTKVALDRQEKLTNAKHDLMKHYTIVALSVAAIFMGAGSFFK